MNTPTIEMERTQALAKLDQYEQAARDNPRHTTDTDRRIADGYKVLAKGGRLIDVNEAIKAGGLNLAGIPKLAIARAHVERVLWRPKASLRKTWKRMWNTQSDAGDTGGLFEFGRDRGWNDARIGDDRAFWRVPNGTFSDSAVKLQADRNFTALTPYIPAPHKPRFKLEKYFLLWEANWHALPVDPYLLRPITGALMEVVAEWDVTPLELAAVRAATANR